MEAKSSQEANALFDAMMEVHHHEPKPREDYVRAPFGWPGGKWHSLAYLVNYLPVREVWVDGCGGSGIVTLNRQPSQLEIFNDRHSGIIAFYRCIRDNEKMRALINRLRFVLHSREEFIWSKETWKNCGDDVERAARWYYMIRVSFSQLGRNFGRATSGLPQQARALARSIKQFPGIHDRMKEVQIENLDVIQCIRDFDSSKTVFYIDPDYLNTDPGIYEHNVDHRILLNVIAESRGFFAVSGYANQLYDSKTFWDTRKQWEVMVSSQALAFTDSNNRKGLENVVSRSTKAMETLWIREAR